MRFADATDSVTVRNRLWVANAVLLQIDKNEVNLEQIAQIEGVKRLHANFELSLPKPVKEDAGDGDLGALNATGPSSTATGYNTTYGLDQINATKVWNEYDTMGQGVKVAVLDTGVDISHPDINLYTENKSNETYPGGWAEFDGDGNRVPGSVPHDSAEHGTHTSGTVSGGDASGEYIGVAPKVSLMHGLVIPGGGGSFTQVAAGMQWAANNDADVVSMSLGAPGYFPAMIEPTQNIEAAGAVLVGSAGNSYEGSSGSPGNVYDAIAIGASNEGLGIAPFSSGEVIDTAADWGSDAPAYWPDSYVVPDVSAPGVDVKSSVPGGGYSELSGTSMAAPHTAGAVALMLSAADGDVSNGAIKNALYDTAFKPANCNPNCDPRGGNDTRYGTGIVDAYNATTQVASTAPEFELGDVNESGDVNVQDVRLTQQYLYGEEPETFNANLADMNRNGEVTTEDLRLLQRKVQGTLDEGEIQVSNLTAPATVNDSETINVSAQLENPGDEGAIQQISLHVAENGSELGDGTPVANQTVDMAPEGVDEPVDRPHETTVTFEVDADQIGAGDYHIGVFSENDSASDEITISGSNFEVSDLSAPSEIEQGDAFDVNATITNTGNQEDTKAVEYRFGGTVERTTNVTLAAGESTTVAFEEIETAGVSAGTYDHGVFTEDDSQTANITVLEGFFDVEITDAPDEASVGETVNVSATVENTGNATDEQTVTYDLMRGETAVAIVDSDEGYGDQVAATLREELPDRYNITVVEDQNAMEAVGAYDTFVMQDLDPAQLDVQAFVEATNGQQTGVVWLDGWGSGSDAIPELSTATGDPTNTADGDDGGTPVYYNVTQGHPIFEGVADPGETIEVHNANYADRSWFTGYSGQVIATVGAQNTDQGGSAIGVDDANSTVLASSLGRELFVQNPDFTEAANQTLANTVTYVSGPSGTSVGEVTSQDDTSTNVTLDPGESESVEFTYTIGDQLDISAEWLHTVTSEDDVDTEPVTIDVDRGAVEGTVTHNATGNPIEGATVNVSAAVDDGNYTAVTGADGTYRIENVPAGTRNVSVSDDGYTNETAEVDVPANGTVTQNFTLDPIDGSISGTVTASDTGESVANVTVTAEDNEGNVYEAATGANGTYTLDVPPGSYVVNVADTPGDYRPQEVITVAPGEEVTGVNFEITPRNGSITGYVENAAGVPIEGAHVVDADQGAFNVTTDENGRYEIGDLDRGTYALRAKADGHNATDISFVEVPANGTATQNFTVGSFLAVSDLSAPDTAAQGETINVSATITNTGAEQTTRTVFYFPPGTDFGGDMRAASSHLSERVTLDGGESTTVTFTYDISASREPGEYRHGASADEVASTTITIEESETPGEANYSVSDLSAPATAEPGAEIGVNATITNTGNTTGTQTVEYLFNGSTANTSNVTLAPGESTTVAFSPTVPATEGTYEHGIETADDSVLANISVEGGDPEPAYFAVSNLTGPSEVGQGEEFTATATITNTGDEEGTQTIYPFLSEATAVSQYDLSELGTQEMLANFRPQAAPQEVTLDGGESTTVSFTYEISADKEPGNYSYVASSLQEIASHPLTITAANGSGQASASSAPTLDDRADGLEHQRSVRGVAVIAG
ncbi:S8 family serine peptidase [Halococcus sp. PRR34]|uniref:S8 family serine peptidase n=1 Tax=Halococcus sp. PRR34 TaxID=3020830 RepID=UPI0023625039|nr:S8 family serine peptidase [Halococcus sp. PRR34]